MEMAEFKKIWDAHDGWNKCMMIVFDNSARWILDRKKYHAVYEEIKDKDGNVVNRRRLWNSPKGYYKEDKTIDWLPLKDYLTINESLSTLEMKCYFDGITPDEIIDEKENTPNYGIEVRHVENVQLMVFMDDNNAPKHPVYPLSQT